MLTRAGSGEPSRKTGLREHFLAKEFLVTEDYA